MKIHFNHYYDSNHGSKENMKTDQDYMMFAIENALLSIENVPVGAVIVLDGKIIASTYNSQHTDNNVSSHAEIKALKTAGFNNRSKNLPECTVYTTCEPCTMCTGAIFYAKVKRVVYGARMEDIDPKNQRIRLTIQDLAKLKVNPPIIDEYMRSECLNILYQKSNKVI